MNYNIVRHTYILTSIGIAFTLMVAPYASASPADDESTRFYKQSDQPGWHWYKDPEPEKPEQDEQAESKPKPKQKQKPAQEPKTEVSPAKHRLPKMSDYTKQQLWDMHPDDFQALLEDFKKKAVMTLSEQDINEYQEMQDLARRKALAFTNVTQLVMLKRPDLSLEKDYSTSAPGKYSRAGTANSEREDRIKASSNNFALLYFYKNGCQYCEIQSDTLRMFSQNHGWTIKPVNIESDPNLAAKFNVSTVPMVVLIKRGIDNFLPISTGVVSLNHIDTRVFSGIRLLNGEIRPEQFNMGDFERGGGFDPLAPLQGR